MQILLLYLAEGKKFKKEVVTAILKSRPGFSGLRSEPSGDAVIEADFIVGSEEAAVRLERDLESISISGSGDISLRAAMELQTQYGEPLHLINLDYAFDIDLSEVGSLQDLRRRMEACWEQEGE